MEQVISGVPYCPNLYAEFKNTYFLFNRAQMHNDGFAEFSQNSTTAPEQFYTLFWRVVSTI
jgi:hypothetical protein